MQEHPEKIKSPPSMMNGLKTVVPQLLALIARQKHKVCMQITILLVLRLGGYCLLACLWGQSQYQKLLFGSQPSF